MLPEGAPLNTPVRWRQIFAQASDPRNRPNWCSCRSSICCIADRRQRRRLGRPCFPASPARFGVGPWARGSGRHRARTGRVAGARHRRPGLQHRMGAGGGTRRLSTSPCASARPQRPGLAPQRNGGSAASGAPGPALAAGRAAPGRSRSARFSHHRRHHREKSGAVLRPSRCHGPTARPQPIAGRRAGDLSAPRTRP